MDKKIRLPRENFIDDKDAESLVSLPTDDDVEGHVVLGRNQPDDFTVLPSPPNLGLNRSPGHGGEVRDSGKDTP
ncbi:MAG TPA: hypothetical protein VFU17_14490 [Candidatus Limnocylindrales bacterium]|nr:hypothetical protein [Candidatus Limnocylindrales bacterium]